MKEQLPGPKGLYVHFMEMCLDIMGNQGWLRVDGEAKEEELGKGEEIKEKEKRGKREENYERWRKDREEWKMEMSWERKRDGE